MDYLLDTNIIVIYSRESGIADRIEEKFQLFDEGNSLAISIVTLGELDAIIKKLNLGEKRKKKIGQILGKMAKIGLNHREIISRYGDIDAYSQGKLKNKKGNFSARNMGKNDMWIAATASVFDLTLVTTDKDFDHLHGAYINLERIDIEDYKKK